jgi:hypothetical protein
MTIYYSQKIIYKLIISVFFLIVFFFICSNCLRFYLLDKHGVLVKAQVLSIEPNNHEQVYYSYKADSKYFNNIGSAGFGNPDFKMIMPGMELKAFYLPNEPEISCLGNPKFLFKNELTACLLVLIVFPIFLIMMFIYIDRNKK